MNFFFVFNYGHSHYYLCGDVRISLLTLQAGDKESIEKFSKRTVKVIQCLTSHSVTLGIPNKMARVKQFNNTYLALLYGLLESCFVSSFKILILL